ncbi:MAG: peptide chain release factor N(5)-glutamine methyltransferase [Firmicutes bacterium]|nr:peptide chain release factor N(5)-glutamine methyltransferase [Bacillota bacterium]
MSLLVQDIIKMAETQLTDAGVDNPKGDAEEIYCYLMHVDRSKFFMEWSEPAADRTCDQFFDLVARRANREPLQYIVGMQGFLDLALQVRPGVLIPRYDTEVVAESACEVFKEKKGDTVLEIGCGSGAIAIALAKKVGAKVTAVDINPAACELTKENAQRNGVKIDVLCGDLFEPIKKKKYHMKISNPPYIKTADIEGLMPEVRDHEPREALDGGEDGLEFYRRIAAEAADHLKKDGILVLEIGDDQAAHVAAILTATERYGDIQVGKDLTGKDRAIVTTLAR